MSPDKKKYLMTAIILGAIAMSSGLLIGGAHLITKDPIAQNEINKINSGLGEIYEQKVTVEKDGDITAEQRKENELKFVEHIYYINDENNNSIGRAFKTSGSNSYGKITLIIGFDNNAVYKGLSIIVNEQSFASTLVDEYITPIEEAEDKDRAIADVTCGATYGAKLVRDMINNAGDAFNKIKI